MSSGTTSQTILTEVSIAFDVLDPYYIRFRADDTLLRAKIWTATEDEPSEWMLQASDSNYNSGYPGLIKVGGGAGNSRWSHLAVNAIGGRA